MPVELKNLTELSKLHILAHIYIFGWMSFSKLNLNQMLPVSFWRIFDQTCFYSSFKLVGFLIRDPVFKRSFNKVEVRALGCPLQNVNSLLYLACVIYSKTSFDVCLESLSCWNTQIWPRFNCLPDDFRFNRKAPEPDTRQLVQCSKFWASPKASKHTSVGVVTHYRALFNRSK